MDITRYIVGLAVLLVATVVPLLSAHWLMLRISSSRHRRLQQADLGAAGRVPGTPGPMRPGSTRDGSRTQVPAFPLR